MVVIITGFVTLILLHFYVHLGEVSDPSLLAGDEKGKSWADGKVIVHSQKLLMNDNRSACASSVGGRLWIGEEGCSGVGSERGMLTRLWQGLDPNTLILRHTAVIVMLMVMIKLTLWTSILSILGMQLIVHHYCMYTYGNSDSIAIMYTILVYRSSEYL